MFSLHVCSEITLFRKTFLTLSTLERLFARVQSNVGLEVARFDERLRACRAFEGTLAVAGVDAHVLSQVPRGFKDFSAQLALVHPC